MPTLPKTPARILLGCTLVLALGACSTGSRLTSSPGAVRGQDVQPGQNQQVEMSRQQAEAMVNQGNAGQVGGNAEVAGRPDVAAEQGAMPAGVGYSNNPGELYNPAMGQHTYVHHVIHHVHYNGTAAGAEALNNTAPPSGYVQGRYVVPNNENPNARSWGGNSGYNLGIGGVSHIYQSGANVVHHHYYYGGVPGAGAPGERSFGRFDPNANDGEGAVTEGFDD